MAKPAKRLNLSIMTWTFLSTNMMYGFGFWVLGWWSGVNKSSLYQSLDETSSELPEVWGCALVIAVLVSLMAYYYHNGFLGHIGAMLGFMVWLFATFTYLLTGFYLVVATVGVLYLMFWAMYYFRYVSHISDNGLNARP